MTSSDSFSHPPASPVAVSELRQGNVIDSERLSDDASKLVMDGRAIADYRRKPPGSRLIVLSQDCDIANENEKYLEIVSAKILNDNQARKGLERKFNKPTNYGKLILRLNDQFLEVEAGMISQVKKTDLPEPLHLAGAINEREHQILIDWRVGRYNRKPFPDAFNRIFKRFFAEEGVWNFLEENYEDVLDLWVYVSPDDEEYAEHYDVSITAEMDQDCTDDVRTEVEDRLYAALKELHENTARDTGVATLNFGQISDNWLFGLPDCTLSLAASSYDITLADVAILRRYNTSFACYPD